MINLELIKSNILSKSILYPLFSKVVLLVILFFIGYILRDFFEEAQFLAELYGLFIFYIILTIFFGFGSSLIIFLYKKRNKFQENYIDNFTLGISRLSFFLTHAIFILVSVHILFVNILTLATSLTIVAVAMVLIFKDYISNFINGVLLMFSTDIRLKEFVKIGEFKGRVTNFTFKNVELKSDSGDILYIPNTTVYTKEIINYSKNNVKNISTTLALPKDVFSNFKSYKESLIETIFEKYIDLIKDKSNISIIISEMKKDELQLVIDIITSKYSYKLENEVKNFIFETNLELLKKFEDKKEK
ncbi:MAG: mechanosensitive ion channel family protein [Nanoarchaeota archaeon]|nr:mechanosensitive ion channel family protein [Nanoarchaeota archaeon]